ncbi:UDP:flavonoid glycosyltransferase YjiC, YdhE family [Amycolatopsis pretoriensis]|uniref:UDP:flavonoid glycosyltransferase YjiC, YdhE family n=2 Tax=Amycolatopsis pretoriensis TaxID=218821 RepID=A0A1H5QG11_9PSEU|nr:nucleotide disphospho-sugar-binding domain-containing protein [Amycolatopsis pretoriensis]SEF24308.1 UDP:flavonoid glycosyltransferase YjiC, YdhE family [Amycolatopsis pretoriensis]
MRVLLTSWAWPTHYFWLTPIAWSLRAAGHEVLVAVPPGAVPGVTRGGLPAAAVGADFDVLPIIEKYYWASPLADEAAAGELTDWEAARAAGEQPLSVYALIAKVMQDDLVALVRRWKPDLMVFDAVTYAGPLAAAACGVPAVRQIWGADYSSYLTGFAPRALAAHRAALGLDDVDVLGVATLDPCPPSLQRHDDVHRFFARHLPYNGSGVAPRWLLEPKRRKRICVTWGTIAHVLGERAFGVDKVLDAFTGVDAEVVCAVSPRDRERLGVLPANVRVAENLPLHLLLPSCDLIVSQGGAGAVASAITAGVPQVCVPHFGEHVLNARAVADGGAGELIPLDAASAESVRDAVERVLGSASYEKAAAGLAEEAAAQPALSEVVTRLPELAGAKGSGTCG